MDKHLGMRYKEQMDAGKYQNLSIIFFDGVCGLCNKTVDFVISRDPGHQFHFAPLQGEVARQVLGHGLTGNSGLDSIVLWDKGRVLESSEAVLTILTRLGGAWGLLKPLLWIPKAIREWGYFFIAKRRYQWFGKRDSCRLPTPLERNFFLD